MGHYFFAAINILRITLKISVETAVGLHGEVFRYCCRILTKTGMCGHVFVKLSTIIFHENPLGVSGVVTREHTERQRGMAELMGRVLHQKYIRTNHFDWIFTVHLHRHQ
jgi:hypothetical protein